MQRTRTILGRSTPDERTPPRILPVGKVSSAAFLYIAFGGHDSWLREIKFKLPDVRFLRDDISSPEIIKRADVVWIQTNCIGHKSYNIIIELARRYNRRVRYFAYASATKCAEQVVAEEENTVK